MREKIKVLIAHIQANIWLLLHLPKFFNEITKRELINGKYHTTMVAVGKKMTNRKPP